MSAHKWTTEPPTGPGFYWASRGGGPHFVELLAPPKFADFVVRVFGARDNYYRNDFHHWMRVDVPPLPSQGFYSLTSEDQR